jgi:rhamnosyltransferase subunit B
MAKVQAINIPRFFMLSILQKNTNLPKRIVLSTFGSLGDINPYIGIALELKARGHRPVIATTETHRERVEALAISFHPVRPALPSYDRPDEVAGMMEKCMDRKTGMAEILNSFILPHLRDIYQDLSNAVCGSDLLVTHPLSLVGPIIAQKTGIPWVSSVLAPAALFSAYDPPVVSQLPSLQKLLALSPSLSRLFLKLVKWWIAPMFEPVYRLRAELGLPPGEHPTHSPALVLALFSSVLAKPQPDWPPQTRITGFPFYDHRGQRSDGPGPSPELMKFLEQGPPPIVFTLGSTGVWVAKGFYRESVEAVQALNQRALLLIGNARNRLPVPLPPKMAAFDYAPYSQVLPRASIIVHHGGIGTTGQSLRAGKPMLVVPLAHDQFDNAARIARLGLGRVLAHHRYTAARAIGELRRLIQEPSYAKKATDIAHRVQSEDGIQAACDAIEEKLYP